MERKKTKALWLISSGGLIGALIASWLGPKSIIWWSSPAVDFGVNCQKAVDWGLHKLLLVQGLGLLIGGLFGLMGFVMLLKRSVHRQVDEEFGTPREPQT